MAFLRLIRYSGITERGTFSSPAYFVSAESAASTPLLAACPRAAAPQARTVRSRKGTSAIALTDAAHSAGLQASRIDHLPGTPSVSPVQVTATRAAAATRIISRCTGSSPPRPAATGTARTYAVSGGL